MTFRRWVAPTLALLLPALVLTFAPARATDPVTLTVTGKDTDVPLRAPFTPDEYFPATAEVTVAADQAVANATFTTTVDGVQVDPATGDTGALSPDHPVTLDLALTGVDPGLHSLTVTVSAPDAAPAATSFPFVWVPGNQAVTGTDSLAGRAYERSYSTLGSFCEYCSVRYTTMTWFVDDSHVATGNAVRGRPDCAAGCRTYRYDSATGLVQIGDDVLARLDEGHAVFVSERFEDPEYGTPDTVTYQPLTVLPTHHVRGTWVHKGSYLGNPDYVLGLRLDRSGHYDLWDGGGSRTRHEVTGRYRLSAASALHLLTRHQTSRAHRHWPRVATLLALATPDGRRDRPAGVWLTVYDGHDDDYYDQDEARGFELTPR